MPRKPRPFSTANSLHLCSHCGHPIGVTRKIDGVVENSSDLHCCPAGVSGRHEKSPHCLWCGDDLTTTRSFCNHHCSTSYHQDISMKPGFLARRSA